MFITSGVGLELVLWVKVPLFVFDFGLDLGKDFFSESLSIQAICNARSYGCHVLVQLVPDLSENYAWLLLSAI